MVARVVPKEHALCARNRMRKFDEQELWWQCWRATANKRYISNAKSSLQEIPLLSHAGIYIQAHIQHMFAVVCSLYHVCTFLKGTTPEDVGWDSSVGIAARYGLDGPEIQSWKGEIFRTRLDWPWGPSSLLYNGYLVSFPGVKGPNHSVKNLPPSSAEVKESVELFLYYLSGPSWPVLGRILTLLLHPKVFGLWYRRDPHCATDRRYWC